ncbi:hypothetical protein ACWD7T_33180 [Streptomyces sp. 900116325]
MTVIQVEKSAAELEALYGPMRRIEHHQNYSTDVPREQYEAFRFNIAAGKRLRESVITGADGTSDLIIWVSEYIEPGTLATRYAVDYWSVTGYWTTDHDVRVMAELSYEIAVRAEFAAPTLALSLDRFSRGLASFYDVTDVI